MSWGEKKNAAALQFSKERLHFQHDLAEVLVVIGDLKEIETARNDIISVPASTDSENELLRSNAAGVINKLAHLGSAELSEAQP